VSTTAADLDTAWVTMCWGCLRFTLPGALRTDRPPCPECGHREDRPPHRMGWWAGHRRAYCVGCVTPGGWDSGTVEQYEDPALFAAYERHVAEAGSVTA
jgi:hypothetical protein